MQEPYNAEMVTTIKACPLSLIPSKGGWHSYRHLHLDYSRLHLHTLTPSSPKVTLENSFFLYLRLHPGPYF
jgi:hypothetical protein